MLAAPKTNIDQCIFEDDEEICAFYHLSSNVNYILYKSFLPKEKKLWAFEDLNDAFLEVRVIVAKARHRS